MRLTHISPAALARLIVLGIAALGSATSAATLNGTVGDPSARGIPEASVKAANADTNIVSSTVSDGSGLYVIPNLPPGTYRLTVQKDGFKTIVRPGVVLHTDTVVEINFTMEVGSLTQSVTIEAGAPIVDLASATISGNVNNQEVLSLPLNARSWTDLATLTPGVASIRSLPSVTNPDRLGRGLGNQLTISGGRPQQNNYLINGISMNDYTNGAPGSMLGGNLGVDAIQEFSVLTSNFSAQYGRTSGGVISGVTRSGTNGFHGNVYEFLRNSALDARNFFDGAVIPPFRRNQFGASEGGPIQKDKTFFFGDYEGLRQSLGLSNFDTVPSQTARNGIVTYSDPSQFPSGCSQISQIQCQVNVNSLVKPFFGFYPLPNGPIICPIATCPPGVGDTGIFQFGGSQISTENFFTVRLDHTFSSKDNVFGTYMFDNSNLNQTDEFDNKIIHARSRRQVATMEESHVFTPTFVNSARAGFNRSFGAAPLGATAVNPLAADTSLGFAPGESAGLINVPGFTPFSGGLSTQVPQQWAWTSFQAGDDIFLTRGVHSFRFGANYEEIRDNSFAVSAAGGNFIFDDIFHFLTNQPHSLTVAVPRLSTGRGMRQTIFGTYVQDDMKVFPNLTVNVALRYEMATVPSEVNGKLARLVTLTGPALYTGNPIYSNSTLHNFEPRVGLAWDPFRNGKTAVRAAFGVFDVLPAIISLRGTVFATWPFADGAKAPQPMAQGSFPIGAFSTLTPDESTARVQWLDPNPQRNYVMQWNLSIQQALSPGSSILIAYVGSRTVHNALQTGDVNGVLPTATPAGLVWPCGPDGTGNPCGAGFLPTGTQANPIPAPLLNPNVGQISGTFFDSDAHYNALQVQFMKRRSHGLQVQASYTWARAIDTSSGTTDPDQFTNGLGDNFFFNSAIRRGPSDFNIDDNISVNYDWDIPNPRSITGLLAWPLSGWELGGIVTVQGGVPFTPLLGGDVLGQTGNSGLDFPKRLNGPGCQTAVNPQNVDNYIKLQCFAFPNPVTLLQGGRNVIIGPGLVNVDMSIFKNNPVKRISESFNVQFRAEAFNIFNRPNFGPPINNSTLFDQSGNAVPGAGLIDTTTTTSRQLQFAVKIIW
jgi:Carboxypeptidase regulatory-like domain/TonB-dependent Receptor Plug Domain